MFSDVIQTAKYGTVTKELVLQILFTDRNNFLHVKCLISESYLGPPQHLSWNSFWRKLMTESH